jgi:hypothetical protein
VALVAGAREHTATKSAFTTEDTENAEDNRMNAGVRCINRWATQGHRHFSFFVALCVLCALCGEWPFRR